MRLTERLSLFVIALVASCGVSLCDSWAQDADVVARELSNPATSLASLANKLEYRIYDGDVANANDQEGWKYVFQPVLPFPQGNGDKIIFRPAFNVLLDEPYFDGNQGRFDSGTAFGDIGFDLVYAPKTDGRLVWGAGMVGGLPTATDSDFGGQNWTAGPELFVAWIDEWGLLGGLLNHSTKIAGSGAKTNLSSLQYFAFASLGDGWQLGAGPTITYDWEAPTDDAWNVPVGIGLAKTTTIGSVTVKFNAEVDYSPIRQDSFGPEWLVKFTVTPVIANPFE